MSSAAREPEIEAAEVSRAFDALPVRGADLAPLPFRLSATLGTPCAAPLVAIIGGFVVLHRWNLS